MMVAATILEEYVGSVRIFLFEKNTHCGAKVLISGG
jgi:predicted flavoprotein YhiN